MKQYIGYACINESLKPDNYRTCRLGSIEKNGIDYLRDRALHNVKLLQKILRWNLDHDIYMYRILSDVIPLVTHPDILKNYSWRWYLDDEIMEVLNEVKSFVNKHKMRLSMHPDQYTVINSDKDKTVKASIEYLDFHAQFLEAVGGNDIIIHTGGVYGDKAAAKDRFINVYKSLSDLTKSYLILENDDRSYTIEDVLDISDACEIPVCFDIHHHRCLSGTPVTKDLMNRIFATWQGDKPKMHVSSGKEFPDDRRHHDYISESDGVILFELVGDSYIDIMVEAKRKEAASMRLRDLFDSLHNN